MYISPEDLSLENNPLCYGHVKIDQSGKWSLLSLYPVMISRKLYDMAALYLLPDSLRPATRHREPLSRGTGCSAGSIRTPIQRIAVPRIAGTWRVGAVESKTSDAVTSFTQAVPLAILGQPKPAQGRFYLGDANGNTQADRISKEAAGYRPGNRIRGPKVYPHHTRFVEDPDDPSAGWVRRKDEKGVDQDKQNRSITGWVRAGAEFEFDLHVENLSRIDLGALVWLLSLPAGQFLRMGLGKPLGFGSVRAEIVAQKTRIADGSAWAARIRTWEAPLPEPCDLEPDEGRVCLRHQRGEPDALAVVRAAAKGFAAMPVHYPRLRGQRVGSGDHFKWFVENEKEARISLPDLLHDPALPLL